MNNTALNEIKMQVIDEINHIKALVKEWKKQNFSLAFVPTMGFLHEGHLSLIKAAKKCDKVIVSIFVNPMQFGANEDFKEYPRALQEDIKLCEKEGVDLLFTPKAEDFYPADFSSFVDMHSLTDKLCGASRKGHFRGVCTVLCKFFNIIEPDFAYFGQKDAQQCLVVAKMIKDLNMKVELKICPIIREKDGLAKSSRNVYLNEEQRKAALVLSRAVFLGQNLVQKGQRDAAFIKEAMLKEVQKEKAARLDYIAVVDVNTLQDLKQIKDNVLAAIAVYIGKTRLIDNFLIKDLK